MQLLMFVIFLQQGCLFSHLRTFTDIFHCSWKSVSPERIRSLTFTTTAEIVKQNVRFFKLPVNYIWAEMTFSETI